MNILILNGPNLNRLGKREPDVYGSKTYEELESYCYSFKDEFHVDIDVKQSNLEGILIDILHYADDHYDGVIFNPGAFTHYSYALYDAIKSIAIPVVEVHLSDITKREPFRQVDVIKDACIGTIMGLGFESYKAGLKLLVESSDTK